MAKMVYNSSQRPWGCTKDGRICFPGEWAVADDETAERQAEAGRLNIVDLDTIPDSGSNPMAIMVKQEVQELNNQKSNKPSADAGTTTKASTKRAKK